jgi:hypothetical protein
MSGSESATLYRLADQLDEQAAAVRSRARRLVLAGTRLRWNSTAAGLFRDRLGELVTGLHRSATALERSADALRRHARAVHRVEEVARAVERAGEQVAHGVARVGRFVSGWM